MVKIREDGTVQNRAVYVANAIDMEGQKEVLGLWSSANEGAKFYLSRQRHQCWTIYAPHL